MTGEPEIITVDRSNVKDSGFFCSMSKRKSEGFLRKLAWAQARFSEGMRIKLLKPPERGFIEYIPGKYAWRAVKAEGYMVIHCLWVVGKSKGKGFGAELLDECVADARKAGMAGVAMVTSEDNWLAGKRWFEGHGFKAIDAAPPSFTLMLKKFKQGPNPSFPRDWAARAARFGKGLTILSSGQCPYLPDAGRILLEAAARKKIKARVVEFRSAAGAQDRSPSPYGVFSIVYNGRLVGHHYLVKEDALGLFGRNLGGR